MSMLKQLVIYAANVTSLLSHGFTKIEVWCKADDSSGFEEITGPVAVPASVASMDAINTFRAGGKALSVSVNGADPVEVTFGSSLLLWSPAQVVARINAVVAGLASLSDDEKSVILTAPTSGRASEIAVTSCTIPNFIEAGTVRKGIDARPTLTSGTFAYIYTDLGGSEVGRYKWRYSANGVIPRSLFSEPTSGEEVPYDVDSMSVGVARFVDVFGKPSRAALIISSATSPLITGAGVMTDAVARSITPDEDGLIQVALVRGAVVRIGFEGNTLVREFTVPDAPTFDLLTETSAAPDLFVVQEQPQHLTRRTI